MVGLQLPILRMKEEEGFMEWIRSHNYIKQIFLYGVVFCCGAVLVSLCFNEGIDYDEAFSFSIIHNSPDVIGIIDELLASPYNDVIPLWHMALKLGTIIFGERFVVCKLFTVLGSVCTMMLGATVVRKNWGCKTALLFIIPAGLAPGLMHVGVNIRTYSWTVFLVTACALTAYKIVRNPQNRKLWLLLFFTTVTGLLCHHFTAFSYLFIYLYLFVELLRKERKSVWKLFVCGFTALIPFCLWLYISDFFHMSDVEGGRLGIEKVLLYDWKEFIFHTSIPKSGDMGMLILILAVGMLCLFWKRFEKQDRGFLLLGLSAFLCSYVLSAILSTASNHFIAPRHTMHTQVLLWLGLAIILSRINVGVYLSGLVYVICLCSSNYSISYGIEYRTIPYLAGTKAFIAENMQEGDIVIYNAEKKFSLLYECYMPAVEYVYFPEMTEEEIRSLSGKRVWFMLCKQDFFTQEQQQQYGITYENMGHYGFQIIADCTDFDMLRIEIEGD